MATAKETRASVIKEMRSLKGTLAYRNDWVGPSLAQTKARKAGDCSDLTHAVFGQYGYKLGGMSRDQAKDGTSVAKWSGKRGGGVTAFNKIYKKVRQADIIVMDLTGGGYPTHVETITADKSGNSIGHGWGTGPKEQNLGVSWLLPKAYSWEVRRIIPDDKKTTTTKKKSTVTQAQKINYIYGRFKKVEAINKRLKRIDNLDARQKRMEKTLNQIAKKVGA